MGYTNSPVTRIRGPSPPSAAPVPLELPEAVLGGGVALAEPGDLFVRRTNVGDAVGIPVDNNSGTEAGNGDGTIKPGDGRRRVDRCW